jgi:hypothetical protein
LARYRVRGIDPSLAFRLHLSNPDTAGIRLAQVLRREIRKPEQLAG